MVALCGRVNVATSCAKHAHLQRLVIGALICATLVPFWLPAHGSAATAAFLQPPPKVSAQAVYAIDVTAGVELYALNADERRPPASTTKIATALVVVRSVADLNEPVTIEDADVAEIAADESQMGLVVGDVLTIEQLLYGLLIQSGNDAAAVLARVVGGKLLGNESGDPTKRFVEEMNRLAADLGLTNTHFTNAAGLYDPNHYSTARDLAVLAETALQNKTLAKIVKQQRETIVSLGTPPHEYQLRTTNRLLGEAGIHGVKTGSLPQAGACLVLAKYVHGRNRVIVVVLGSEFAYDADGMIDPDSDLRWADARTILDALERDFRWLSPADPNDLPGLTDELAAWQVTLKDESAIVIPASQADAFRYRLKLGPEGLPDQPVGSLLFFLGTTQIAERPLFQLAAG
ncbi:MAG: hypothetical protein KatS3mg059_0530 [Thermomicrobiales bacterium]|nr:MAG: hypothetical protein KatS3mg059_0530 [Thermomicrobiales bacterium]